MSFSKTIRSRRALRWAGLFTLAILATSGRGDEPGRLGRFFRDGSSPAAPSSEPVAEGRPSAGLTISAAPATSLTPRPRILPQPRVSRPLTDADPIVTRISLARSDDGNSFGMFLQVYADGTVIDSEGAHRLGREAVREVLSALEQGDLYRIKGHCGNPSTDFVEQVQMIVFERSLGRLRANAFSFSGNPQGCDASIKRLQTALDALQARLSKPISGSSPNPVTAASLHGPTPTSAPIQLNGGIRPLNP